MTKHHGHEEEPQPHYFQKRNVSQHGGTGGILFLGFVGTLVYQLHFHSGTFKLVFLAFLKAIFWLPYLVYQLLQYMQV